MRPVRFLAALLVLASFTLPWVYLAPDALNQAGISGSLGSGGDSFLSLFQNTYSPSFLSQVASELSRGNYYDLVYALGVLFIGLGAVVGLANRAGHFVGILGMVLVSYFFLRVGGLSFVAHLWNGGSSVKAGMDMGYLITWLGFLIGASRS